MTASTDVRYRRLRPAVHVAPVDAGLAFVGWSDSFVLTGPTAAVQAVWRAAAPALEHGVDPGLLLDTPRSPAVRGLLLRLLDELDAHGMLLSVPPTHSAADASRYAALLAYLDAVAEDPSAALLALRQARVAVDAPADLTFAVVRTLLRTGIGTVGTRPARLDLARLGAYLPEYDAELTGLDGAWDVVIAAPTATGTTGRVRLEVCLGTEHAGVARVLTGGVERGWADRLGTADDPSPVLVALAGGLAAHEAVAVVAGLPARATGRRVLLIDAVDLATTEHRVPPATGASTDPVRPVNASAEEILTAAEALTGPVFGVLQPPHPGATTQLPLAFATCGKASGIAETGAWARVEALAAAVRALPPAEVHGVVAAGFDPHGVTADALTRCLVAEVDRAELGPFTPDPDADRHAWRWLKALVVRWGLRVDIRTYAPAVLPTWRVAEVRVGTGTYLAAGPDRLAAVRTALRQACGAVQATVDPAGPPLPDPVAAPDVPPDEVDAALVALAAHGRRLVLRPWTALPALAEAGIRVVHAELCHV